MEKYWFSVVMSSLQIFKYQSREQYQNGSKQPIFLASIDYMEYMVSISVINESGQLLAHFGTSSNRGRKEVLICRML